LAVRSRECQIAAMSSFKSEPTAGVFDGRSRGHMPGQMGLQILTRAAEVRVEGENEKIALFRCTQRVRWPAG